VPHRPRPAAPGTTVNQRRLPGGTGAVGAAPAQEGARDSEARGWVAFWRAAEVLGWADLYRRAALGDAEALARLPPEAPKEAAMLAELRIAQPWTTGA
jgi:hypothetical protein